MNRHAHLLSIDYRRVDDLKLNPRNARSHNKKQIAQISASISEFGFTNPILVDESQELIAGHGRLLAARELKLGTVPTITIVGLSAMQKRALMLADNKIALNAGWDLDLLRVELVELSIADLNFDVGITGFETPEIDFIVGEPPPKQDPADQQIDPDEIKEVVTRPGDVWQLGRHRLCCGDALDAVSYEVLLGDDRAQMVVSDPPFNVAIDGHVSGLGRNRHAEFKMASGEMTEEEFVTFLNIAVKRIAAVTADGAIIELFMDWRHVGELLAAARPILGKPVNLCVWNKTNGGMGSLFRSKHELVFVFKKGSAPHINNVELGKHGRYRTNVWDYAGTNAFRRGRDQDLEDHPTIKPVAMIADAILDCSKRNGIILDPFGGSGTLILAAERTGRQARVIELDPKFVDVAIRRWTKLSGQQAVLAETSESFDQVALQRRDNSNSLASANAREGGVQ